MGKLTFADRHSPRLLWFFQGKELQKGRFLMLEPLTGMTDILIVENERVTAWDLQEALESLGYRITGNTGSGQQAIALAVETRPNLVIMDIRLQENDMDGITAAGKIRRELGIPVIYLTAYADDQTLSQALKTQPFGYLVKPFNPIELRTTIETALQRDRIERQLHASLQWFSPAHHTCEESLEDGAIASPSSPLHQSFLSQVDALERLNHLKDDFLSTVSHELRTPMANIRMATQMLEICLKRLGVMEQHHHDVEKYFAILKQEGLREINLIDDLLNISRLEAGIEELNPILIDLRLWVVHIAEPFIELAQRHCQELTLDVPAPLPLIEADLSCLERLFRELLTNACKYTPPGERIHVSVTLQDRWLDLHVMNTGVEIPAAEIPQVFKKFYRIPKGDRWKHGGTGLGLALAQKLADALSGYLWVTSAHNEVVFTLRLPLPAASSWAV